MTVFCGCQSQQRGAEPFSWDQLKLSAEADVMADSGGMSVQFTVENHGPVSVMVDAQHYGVFFSQREEARRRQLDRLARGEAARGWGGLGSGIVGSGEPTTYVLLPVVNEDRKHRRSGETFSQIILFDKPLEAWQLEEAVVDVKIHVMHVPADGRTVVTHRTDAGSKSITLRASMTYKVVRQSDE